MTDTRMCPLNGQYNAEKVHFTSTCISLRWICVVDYHLTPTEFLRLCESFEVVKCADAIDNFILQYLLNNKSKMPDHSILLVKVKVSYIQENVNNGPVNIEANIYDNSRLKMCCFEHSPHDFLHLIHEHKQ
jgi:hypothetical protein